MKTLAYLFSTAAVILLAFWAYNENYATQELLGEVRALNREIGAAHARLALLQDEWAYLNRPDRLHDLVVANFDSLALGQMTPDSFGSVMEVAFPVPPEPVLPVAGPITDPIAVASNGATAGEEPL